MVRTSAKLFVSAFLLISTMSAVGKPSKEYVSLTVDFKEYYESSFGYTIKKRVYSLQKDSFVTNLPDEPADTGEDFITREDGIRDLSPHAEWKWLYGGIPGEIPVKTLEVQLDSLIACSYTPNNPPRGNSKSLYPDFRITIRCIGIDYILNAVTSEPDCPFRLSRTGHTDLFISHTDALRFIRAIGWKKYIINVENVE